MSKPQEFYTTAVSKYEAELAAIIKQLNASSILRFSLFVAIIVAVYYFSSSIHWVVLILLIGALIFVYLVSRHNQLKGKAEYIKALLAINQKELKIQKQDFHSYNDGAQYLNPVHYYSYDIDLFGKGSFFQYANRTVTQEGEEEWVKQLTANDFTDLRRKQEAIKDLAQHPKWRQDFSATAKLVKVQYPSHQILEWIRTYNRTLHRSMAILPLVFGGVSLLLIALIIMNVIPYGYIFGWLAVGLGISGKFSKRVGKIYNQSSKAKDTFAQYHKLLDKIELKEFSSELLQEKQNAIATKDEKASVIFKKISKILDGFDQRNNMLVAFLGNGLFLYDVWYASQVEKWIERYDEKIEDWFEVISFFDAMNTSANFCYNHPSYIFPSINSDANIIQAEGLGHPLLKPEGRIDNDFMIEDQQFFIVTGANMAGKSTFLRTVSLSIVMANMGLPVCAASFEYTPIKLITSMRTSDSLVDDASYFFSELKRLKFIVDQIKKEKYFIILDEILKGTNSTDKAIGSKKFVEKLVASNSTGIIATHDLSLCAIEDELPEVKNYYFDAEIVDDELYFDYLLKEGICKNMNASFLLKKMEIV